MMTHLQLIEQQQCPSTSAANESLDPKDWNELCEIGHKMLDEMFIYLRDVRERPVWKPLPDEVRERLNEPLPGESLNVTDVFESFKQNILPYPTGNIHPRFWGWVMGTGTPLGMLADMLASGMNTHVAGYDQAATVIEKQVLAWLTELMAMPSESSGLLVSGGTMANLTALIVARNTKAGFDLRKHGLQFYNAPKLTFYGSAETHSWAQKAAELLGLGNDSFRRIPVNENYEIDIDALQQVINADRFLKYQPFCVIGNAGTVNTGATDNLKELAALCSRENLWFHIDGAFGALAVMSQKYRSIVHGIELADSLAFDLHKWGYLPYEVGCVLVRDPIAHRQAFAMKSDYLTSFDQGIAREMTFFADLGIQLTRNFRALKVWMSFKTHGTKLIGQIIEQNIEQAKYLVRRIDDNSKLELLAPVPLNIVCFRFKSDELSENKLDHINRKILIHLQESGIAVPSGTMINGRFALRVAITNHRSRLEDFDLLIEAICQKGRELI